jgi:hypothetical protein
MLIVGTTLANLQEGRPGECPDTETLKAMDTTQEPHKGGGRAEGRI